MIELQGVHKSYGAIKILENFAVTVRSGESFCVYGPSGCGKSTLLKVIALIAPVDAGSVVLDGVDTARLREVQRVELRRKVGYSFQEGLLLPYLNAIENVVALNSMTQSKETTELEKGGEQLLRRLNLSDRVHHYPGQLSVGEKKRVDLARAVLRKPPILVADEPTSNLDPQNIEVVHEMFRELREVGTTVVYSAVDPAEAKLVDQALLIERRLTTR
jgi:ABC-type lipoprotein export system ATPase subunit